MNRKVMFALSAVVLAFTSCKKEEVVDTPTADEVVDASKSKSSILISNEGNFMSSNASLSIYQANGIAVNDAFKSVNLDDDGNSISIGDVLQSVVATDNYILLAVNNSQSVHILSRSTLKLEATLTGASYPRFLHVVDNNKVYLTNGSGAGEVKIINLNTLAWDGSVSVGTSPEKMTQIGNHVFVTNKGDWGATTGSTVSVIDVTSNTVVKTIEVGVNPTDICASETDAFVLCSGTTVYDTSWNVVGVDATAIYKLNASSLTVTSTESFAQLSTASSQLEISNDGTSLFLQMENSVKQRDVNDTIWTSFIANASTLSGLSVSPWDDVYALFSPNYTDPGTVVHYNVQGSVLDSAMVGIIPSGVAYLN
jgi:YVTN family beta-propeller protein